MKGHRLAAIEGAGNIVHDRAMPGYADVDGLGRLALDFDFFGNDLHILPGTLELVLVGVGRVNFFHVEVLRIAAHVGNAPGYPLIVADNHTRHTGESDPRDIPTGRL